MNVIIPLSLLKAMHQSFHLSLNISCIEKLWDKAVAELLEFRTNNLHLIGGTALPVWDKLPTENVRIYRVLTSHG
jgi:hypothetical protein